MRRVLLAELVARGVRLEPHEVVAIAQQLIRRGAVSPSPQNIRLGTDGSVECVGCDTTPGVYELAIFLQTLLPPERIGVPGGLRYAIARGLHEVEARPFDSIDELSNALERFEKGERRAVVAQLVRRVVPDVAEPPAFDVEIASPVVIAAPEVMRGEAADPPAVLLAASHEATRAEPRRPRWWAAAFAVAAALVICALAGFAAVRLLLGHTNQSAAAHSAPVPMPGERSAATVEPHATATPSAPAQSLVATEPAAAAAAVPARPPSATTLPVSAPRTRRTASGPSSAPDEALVEAVDAHRRPVFSPAFASNGSAMFFHTGGARDPRSAIASANSYDLQVMTIVDDGSRNYHVQPSPDGETIAFDSDRDGERGVYLARRDGTEVRRITGAGYAAVPTWSPDGRRIAYIRAELANPKVWNLWIQSLGDGRETRLTRYRYGQTWSASWFPDGRRICYSHEDRLVIVNLDTGREQVIESPVKGRLVRTPAVSPDGTKVIFQVYRHGAWLFNVADQSMRFVLTDPTAEEFAWAPDGRHVAFHSRRDGAWGIYVIAG